MTRRLAALFVTATLFSLAASILVAPSPTLATPHGVQPEAIKISSLGIVAPVEVRTTVGGQMQDPTGPEVVAWYDDSALLGAGGNTVFSGHLDLAGYGPAIFANLDQLERGDTIVVRGANDEVFRYQVVWVRSYPAPDSDWTALTGPTSRESITLITCAPPWDDAAGHYANRLVVRAKRVDN